MTFGVKLPACLGVAAAVVWVSLAPPATAQWTHRYPKVESFGHQIYLEQEHLPILSSGPVYPAASPDGVTLAFAHQGWIWAFDLRTGVARRLTNTGGVDSRPRWSPDGKLIAFVRDGGADTSVVIVGMDGAPFAQIDTPAIDLDPEFTRDGKFLLYTSAKAGRLELWRRNLENGSEEVLTNGARVARSARALRDGRIVYQEQVGGPSHALRLRNADGTNGPVLFQQGWMAHLNPDAHPDERSIVFGVGEGNMVRLAIMDVDQPALPRWLTPASQKALFPTWSADGSQIYYVQGDARQQFNLMVVGAAGGTPRQVQVKQWDYGAPIGELAIVTRSMASGAAPQLSPARLSITRADGHPVVNPAGPTFVDNQNGPVYFYTDGQATLPLPEGDYRIVATHGPFSQAETQQVRVKAGRTTSASLDIKQIWDARRAGFASADHHVHLNASGVNELDLQDLLLPMQGEDLDFAAPMAWNQTNRFIDADRIGQKAEAKNGTSALLSQEVRSDYHGHIGMIGALKQAFQPWFFGPTTPVYGNRDLHNGLVAPFAKAQGLLASYVHPVDGDGDPFADLAKNELPHELVLDGVLSDGMGLEVVCQWTSPLGTAHAWYRFLNIGRSMPATSGTDMMANFYRAPAVGTARAYVPATGNSDFASAVEQVRSGKGFVTTGPALLFKVGEEAPGGVVSQGSQDWSIELISVRAVDRVEIIVNGQIVQTLKGFAGNGRKRYSGKVTLPTGGWVAARAVGGKTGWPIMSYTHFAHTQPLWIGRIGSTEPATARAAANDLLRAVAYSEREFAKSYGTAIPPGLVLRIADARRRLSQIAAE